MTGASSLLPVARGSVWALLLLGCNVSTPLLPGGMIGGTWGGDNAAVIADDTSAHVHIGCTSGDAHEAIIPVDGRFTARGEYDPIVSPIVRDPPPLHPAIFSGTVSGHRMLLTVTLTDTAVTLGPVVVIYDQEPKMNPCPICRTRAERARRGLILSKRRAFVPR
jgi:hypothetical protein